MVDVFISYSRKDTEFVRRLFDALEAQKRQSWVDWKGIDYSTKWWEEICAGIDHANNFLFIISPDALNSKYCHDEISHARKHNKRIIPFIYIDVDEEKWRREPLTAQALDNWEYLKSLQFISYPKLGNFDQAVAALVANADKDPKHVQAQTELLAAAQAWINAGKSPGFLLRDERLTQAETWLKQAQTESKDPLPTLEQVDYIAASRKRTDADRTSTRQMIAATIGLVVVVILFGVASLVLFGQATDANNQAATALVAQGQAVAAQETSASQISTATVEQGKAQQQVAIAGMTLTPVPATLAAVASAIADAKIEQEISAQMANASLLLTDKVYGGALRITDQLVKDYPDKAIAYVSRGLIYVGSNQPEKAIADFNKAIQLSPNSAAYYNNRAAAYHALHDDDKAIADYNQAITLDPTYSTAYSGRGSIYRTLQEYSKAIADYNQAIALEPDDATSYSNRGHVYTDMEEYAKAVEDYNQAIALDAQEASAYSGRGSAYLGLKQYAKALSDYDAAIALNSTDAISYSNRGSAYSLLQQYDKAVADFNAAIALDPKYTTAYVNRGIAYDGLKQFDQAIADYTTAIELDSDYLSAYTNRGIDHVNLSQFKEAIPDFDNAIRLDAKNVAAYHNRGIAYLNLAEYEKTINDSTKAIELNPKNSESYLVRGLTYYVLGRNQEALADWDQYEVLGGTLSPALEIARADAEAALKITPTAIEGN